MPDTYTAQDHLYLSNDRKSLVSQDNKDSSGHLYAFRGDELPLADAERFGLVKKAPAAADKQKEPAKNKTRKRASSSKRKEGK